MGMNRTLQNFLVLIVWIVFMTGLSACCHAKKQGKEPSAREALPDRNTRDPKLSDTPPNFELQDTTKKQ